MTFTRPLCTPKPALLGTGTEARGCCNNYRKNSCRGWPCAWLGRLSDTSAYLDFGIPHPGILFRAPGPRGAEKGTLHPRSGSPGLPASCLSDQQGIGRVPLSSGPLRASQPSASLLRARGHEQQEQDVEEKIFCCVNTGPGLRWMNSTRASAVVGGFEGRAWRFHSQASDRRRRPTPQERERGCVSDAAPTRKEAQRTMPAAQRTPLTRPSGEPGPPGCLAEGSTPAFPLAVSTCPTHPIGRGAQTQLTRPD